MKKIAKPRKTRLTGCRKSVVNSEILASMDQMIDSSHRMLALTRLLEYCQSVPEEDLNPATVSMAGTMMREELDKFSHGLRVLEGELNR